jgi:hypothetical protein
LERTLPDVLERADVAGEVDWVTGSGRGGLSADRVHFPLEELSVVPREEGPAAQWLREEEAEVVA